MFKVKIISVGNVGYLEIFWYNGYIDLRFFVTFLNRWRFDWIRNIIYLLNKLEGKLFWREKKTLLVYMGRGMFFIWVF